MAAKIGLKHAAPNSNDDEGQQAFVTDFSVEPGAYGSFLVEIFDQWVRKDVGSIYIMNFEWALEAWLGLPASRQPSGRARKSHFRRCAESVK